MNEAMTIPLGDMSPIDGDTYYIDIQFKKVLANIFVFPGTNIDSITYQEMYEYSPNTYMFMYKLQQAGYDEYTFELEFYYDEAFENPIEEFVYESGPIYVKIIEYEEKTVYINFQIGEESYIETFQEKVGRLSVENITQEMLSNYLDGYIDFRIYTDAEFTELWNGDVIDNQNLYIYYLDHSNITPFNISFDFINLDNDSIVQTYDYFATASSLSHHLQHLLDYAYAIENIKLYHDAEKTKPIDMDEIFAYDKTIYVEIITE